MDNRDNAPPLGPFGGARTTPEPLSLEVSASGIKRPYLWVTLWILFLILVGGAFWYMLLRPIPESEEQIIENSSATSREAVLSKEERAIITSQSSAPATSAGALSEEERIRLLENSSAPTKSSAANSPSQTPSLEQELILRSSSAR